MDCSPPGSSVHGILQARGCIINTKTALTRVSFSLKHQTKLHGLAPQLHGGEQHTVDLCKNVTSSLVDWLPDGREHMKPDQFQNHSALSQTQFGLFKYMIYERYLSSHCLSPATICQTSKTKWIMEIKCIIKNKIHHRLSRAGPGLKGAVGFPFWLIMFPFDTVRNSLGPLGWPLITACNSTHTRPALLQVKHQFLYYSGGRGFKVAFGFVFAFLYFFPFRSVALFKQSPVWHPNISVISSFSRSLPFSQPLMTVPSSVQLELSPPLGTCHTCNEGKEGVSGGRNSVWSTSLAHYSWRLTLIVNSLEVHIQKILWYSIIRKSA